jgi:hypothetical protein
MAFGSACAGQQMLKNAASMKKGPGSNTGGKTQNAQAP